MARRFQAIVCVDVPSPAAGEVGERLRGWLFDNEILLPQVDAVRTG